VLYILLAEGKDENIIKRARASFKRTRAGAGVGTIVRKRIVIILIILAIALVVLLLYTQIYFGNQSYKVENYNALWNQSLADLRSGNTTIDEYCINRVHDLDFCNRFNSLQYFE
jgi:cytochrome c-type biogenesis protein CcmH/NrfG